MKWTKSKGWDRVMSLQPIDNKPMAIAEATGTLHAEIKGRTYQIRCDRRDGFISHSTSIGFILSVNEIPLYMVKHRWYHEDKDEFTVFEGMKNRLKDIAVQIADRDPTPYKLGLAKIPDSQKDRYTQELYHLRNLPHIHEDLDMNKEFMDAAKKGQSPREYRNKGICPIYLDSLMVRFWFLYTPKKIEQEEEDQIQFMKGLKEMRKQEKLQKTKEKPAEKPAEPPPKLAPIPIEEYKGTPAKDRSGSKLLRFFYIADKYPMRLKNAKFSTILKWLEKVRDYFEKRGKYVAVGCFLCFIRQYELSSEDRKRKAGRRLIAILRDEYEAERLQISAMIQRAEEIPKEDEGSSPNKKPKRKKDRFGNKEGTKAFKVNQVLIRYEDEFHSSKFLAKKAGVGSVSSHLAGMMNGGHVIKKVRTDKPVLYRLKTEEEKLAKPKKKKRKKGK